MAGERIRISVGQRLWLLVRLVLACAGLMAAVHVSGAWAVFPGKTGHLLIWTGTADQLYSPPGTSQLTPAPDLANPRYSADDTAVVGSDTSSGAIAVENIDGSDERTVLTPPGGTSYGSPSFSPDGQRVVFGVNDGSTTSIDEVGVDGGGLTTLYGPAPYASGLVAEPDFSPDGTQIVFVSEAGDGLGPIELMPAGGVAVGDAVAIAQDSRNPRFAPDSQHLTFETQRSYNGSNYAQVRVTDLMGSDLLTTLVASSATSGTPQYVAPTFTPDGHYVSYEDCLSSDCGLYSKRVPYAPSSLPSMREDIHFATGADASCCTIPEWEPATQVGPDITSAPPHATASRSAQFEFTEDPDSAYECSLDGAAYSPCDSGVSYTGLADGSHTFKVRVADSGAGAGPATESDWTIDTSLPKVTIDSAPTGSANGPTATIIFHASKPDVAFVCSLDGSSGQPCSSPDTLTGLATGSHHIEVSATDALGNTSATPASAQWGVSSASTAVPGGGVAPASSCVAPAQAAATSGDLTMVGRSGTCLTHDSVNGWTAEGPVTLNGISITPDGGTILYLSDSIASGSFTARGPVTVQLGNLDTVHLPRVFWSQSRTDALDSASSVYGLVQGQIAGLPALPSGFPSITLSSADGGSAVITQKVALPDIFSALPGSAQKVALTLKLTTSNASGLSVAGKVSVGELWLGSIKLKGLELGYDGKSGTFEGSVGADFVAGPGLKLSVKLGSPPAPALLGCCLQKIAISVQSINKPIGSTPIFLQSIGGSASRSGGFLTIGGTVGLSLGPDIPSVGPALSFDGGLSLALSDPWVLEATGGANLFSFPLANGKVVYTYGKGATVTGSAALTLGGYGASEEIKNSFFEGRSRFNLQAVGTVSFPVIGSERSVAVFSSAGFAACASIHSPLADYAIGWGIRFPGRVPQLIADTCDMGPYVVTPTASAVTPIGRPLPLALAAGTGARLLAVHGVGGAPTVTVTGPHGLRVSGPGVHRDGTVIPDAAHDTTFVMLAISPPGRYTVTASDRPISSIRFANALPAVHVHVSTRAVTGGKRLLRFHQTVAPGAHLELYERGVGGTGRRLIHTARAHGELTYQPAPGLGAQRWIVAVTLDRHGIVRDTRRMAPYRVSDAPPARVTHLRAAKHHRLTWAADRAAVSYTVAFSTPQGTREISTTLPRAPIPASSTAAAVVALDGAHRASRAARIALPKH